MKVIETEIKGLKIIELRKFPDDRGFFQERYNAEQFKDKGLPHHFVQDNLSRSKPGVIRGLHFQYDKPQGKLVGALKGQIFDVAVDLRTDSPSFGKWFGIELSESNNKLLWIPPGFAHGFCAQGDQDAYVMYKVDCLYNPSGEQALAWNDPDIQIKWPSETPLVSNKDAEAGHFKDYKSSKLAHSGWWQKGNSW